MYGEQGATELLLVGGGTPDGLLSCKECHCQAEGIMCLALSSHFAVLREGL